MLKIHIAFVVLVLKLTIPVDASGTKENIRPRCSSCSESLAGIIKELGDDLRYANRTIEKDRLAASIGFKLSELESTLMEHAVGLNTSEDLVAGSLNTFKQLVYRTTNSITNNVSLEDGLIKVIENLEKGTQMIDVSRLDDELAKNLALLQVLQASSHTMQIKSQEQADLLTKVEDELTLMNMNYHDDMNNLGRLINIDSNYLGDIIEEAAKNLANQSLCSQELKKIFGHVSSRLANVTHLARLSEDLYPVDSNGIIISNILKLGNIIQANQTCDTPTNPEEKLEKKIQEMNQILTESRDMNQKLEKSKLQVEFMAVNKSLETELVADTGATLKILTERLNNTSDRIVNYRLTIKNLEDQVSGINMTDSAFANLRNLTEDLANKTMRLTNELAREIYSKQDELINMTMISLANYKEKAQAYDWRTQLDLVRILDKIFYDLQEVNATLTSLGLNPLLSSSNLNDSGRSSYSTILDDTKQLRANILGLLDHEISNFGKFVSSLNLGLDSEKTQLRHLNTSLSGLNSIKSPRESLERLNQLVNESLKVHSDLNRQTSQLDNITQNFQSKLVRLQVPTQPLLPLSDIHQSMLMAEGQYSQLKLHLSDQHLNQNKIANLTQFASVSMRKSIEEIQLKIGTARSMLNRAKWIRNFNGKCSVLLKNPTNIADSSSYSSINFLLKPDLSDEGLILFIGTPAINSQQGESITFATGNTSVVDTKNKKQDHQYAEYFAIELRQRRIAVVLCLGSQFAEEVLDDASLASGSWHRISVVRTGTLLTISVASNQSTTSLTRSLESLHTVFNLDVDRSVILVGGLPQAKCEKNKTQTFFSSCKWPPGLKSTAGFTGQVDELRLNGQKLGLWDTVTEGTTPGTSFLVKNSSHPLGFDWPQANAANVNSRDYEDAINKEHNEAGTCSLIQSGFKTTPGQMFAVSENEMESNGFEGESTSNHENHDDNDEDVGKINDELCGGDANGINDGQSLVRKDTLHFSNGYLLFVGTTDDDMRSSNVPPSTPDVDTTNNPLVSFSFKSEIYHSLLMFMQLANSTDFLALQMSAGQLELVVGVNGTIRRQVACLAASMARQAQQQQATMQPLVYNDNLWHKVECTSRVNTGDSVGNGTPTTIHLFVDKKEVGQLNFRQQQQVHELFSKHNSSLAASGKRANATSRLQLLLGGGLNLLQWPANSQQILNPPLANYSLPLNATILHQSSLTNFTGCMRSIKLHGIELTSGELVSKAKRVVNVRERTCQGASRIVSFERPRSNISSSFVQLLNSSTNNDFDELLMEDNPDNLSQVNVANARGHIKRLTLRFKTRQANGLLVHHSRPDHSSFMSIYISGGRLMLAVNFDKKIRVESHIVLNDGLWHTLYLQVNRQLLGTKARAVSPKDDLMALQQFSENRVGAEGGLKVNHSIRVILDDRYMYRDQVSVLLEPINANWASDNKSSRKRSASSSLVDFINNNSVGLEDQHQQEQSQAEKAAEKSSNPSKQVIAQQQLRSQLKQLQPVPYSSSTQSTHARHNVDVHVDDDVEADADDTNNNQLDGHQQISQSKQQQQLQRKLKPQSFGRALNWAASSSSGANTNIGSEQLRKVLYFGGVEDKYIPLLRNQQIPANFHGCLADVTINDIRVNFAQANKNQGVLMDHCHLTDSR